MLWQFYSWATGQLIHCKKTPTYSAVLSSLCLISNIFIAAFKIMACSDSPCRQSTLGQEGVTGTTRTELPHSAAISPCARMILKSEKLFYQWQIFDNWLISCITLYFGNFDLSDGSLESMFKWLCKSVTDWLLTSNFVKSRFCNLIFKTTFC